MFTIVTSQRAYTLSGSHVVLHSVLPMLPRIWSLCLGSTATADAPYVALAEQLEATLVTADARLSRDPAVQGLSVALVT